MISIPLRIWELDLQNQRATQIRNSRLRRGAGEESRASCGQNVQLTNQFRWNWTRIVTLWHECSTTECGWAGFYGDSRSDGRNRSEGFSTETVAEHNTRCWHKIGTVGKCTVRRQFFKKKLITQSYPTYSLLFIPQNCIYIVCYIF